MKKILYPVFAICTILFATSCNTEEKGTSYEVASANDDEQVDPEHIRAYEARPGENTALANADESYQADADAVSAKVAADLKLDEATRARVQQVYYNRNKKLGDLGQGNTSNPNIGSDLGNSGSNINKANEAPVEPNTVDTLRAQANAGTGANNATMSAADTKAARKRITDAADRELQEILTPQQWSAYQQNRTKYEAIK